jgi:hypothetical protein
VYGVPNGEDEAIEDEMMDPPKSPVFFNEAKCFECGIQIAPTDQLCFMCLEDRFREHVKAGA